MKYLRYAFILFLILSLGYLISKESNKSNSSETMLNPREKVFSPIDGVMVYYFHGHHRCSTCSSIEKKTYEVMKTSIDSGKLLWNSIDVQDKENLSFIDAFEVTSSGPIIVEYKNKKAVRWKKLDLVSKFFRESEQFEKYIKHELDSFFQQSPSISYLTPIKAKELINSKNVGIIDLRTLAEYTNGHIGGAINIAAEDIQKNLNLLNGYKNGKILLYCNTNNKSQTAAEILLKNGFQYIVIMEGGIQGWLKVEQPIVKETKS